MAPRRTARGGTGLATSPASLSVVALVLLAAAVLCMLPVCQAMPCPANAFFLYSQHHQASVCACARGLVCMGSQCVKGHPDNYGTFARPDVAGFYANCTDCRCDDFQGRAPDKFVWAELKGGGKMRDFPDPLFDKRCAVAAGPRAPPRSIPRLNWLHFPK